MRYLATGPLIVAASLSFSIHAADIEFKGLQPGAPLKDDRFFCEPRQSTIGDVVCQLKFNFPETIAGARVGFLLVHLIDSKISFISVSFPSDNYHQVKAALLTKYGSGKAKIIPVRTQSGVLYENEETLWEINGRQMRLQRYGNKIDQGMLLLTSMDALQSQRRRAVEQASSNSGDL